MSCVDKKSSKLVATLVFAGYVLTLPLVTLTACTKTTPTVATTAPKSVTLPEPPKPPVDMQVLEDVAVTVTGTTVTAADTPEFRFITQEGNIICAMHQNGSLDCRVDTKNATTCTSTLLYLPDSNSAAQPHRVGEPVPQETAPPQWLTPHQQTCHKAPESGTLLRNKTRIVSLNHETTCGSLNSTLTCWNSQYAFTFRKNPFRYAPSLIVP